MYNFYFNDCLPSNRTEHEIVMCFMKTLPEYKTLRDKYFSHVDGIVTCGLPDQIILNSNGFTLKKCIEAIPVEKKELKRYAYAVFRKFPVQNHFIAKDEDDLIEKDYSITVNNSVYNALNLKIVQESEGILFTLGLHDDLKKDTLAIKSNDNNNCTVLNLYGEKNNTDHIDKEIQALILAKSGNFEKLLSVVGECVYNERFRNSFESFPQSVQDSIIARFSLARNRNGITPFYAEEKAHIIRDVTPDKETKVKVFELKIYDPVACRVFFYEAPDKVYLGLIEKKPNKKKQNKYIKTAANIIKQLDPQLLDK